MQQRIALLVGTLFFGAIFLMPNAVKAWCFCEEANVSGAVECLNQTASQCSPTQPGYKNCQFFSSQADCHAKAKANTWCECESKQGVRTCAKSEPGFFGNSWGCAGAADGGKCTMVAGETPCKEWAQNSYCFCKLATTDGTTPVNAALDSAECTFTSVPSCVGKYENNKEKYVEGCVPYPTQEACSAAVQLYSNTFRFCQCIDKTGVASCEDYTKTPGATQCDNLVSPVRGMDSAYVSKFDRCTRALNEAQCQEWAATLNQKNSSIKSTGDQTQKSYGTIGKFIPGCTDAKDGREYLDSECGNITIFLTLMFNIVDYLFGIIGAIALLFFIYGGFLMILSRGNAEMVEQGKGVIFAAVLGIAIAFGGYALVRFAGGVAGIKSEYRLGAQQSVTK